MISILELYPVLFNEKNCINYLIDKGVIKKIMNCQHCNLENQYYKKLWICKKANCNKSVSVFKNTFFSKANLNCLTVLLIGYLWLNKIKLIQITEITELTPLILIKFIKKFRKMFINSLTPNDQIIES